MDQSHNVDDFPALWAAHQGSLLVYIMGAIPQFHDAQDVLQKVAIVAFRKQEQFDPQRTKFLAWVKAIARYEILHHRRDHARDRLVFDESTLQTLGTVHDSLNREFDERFAALRSCLNALSERSRRVMQLRYGEGVMPGQIAERLNTTANSINVLLAKVRRSLRVCVDRHLSSAEAG